jgi:AraC family transcriptional regulator
MRNPEIKFLSEKKLVGNRLKMSLAENKTHELWRGFMPRRKEIKNNVSAELFSMQVYDASFDFKKFDPLIPFEKWAAVEVTDFNSIPPGMEKYTLSGGRYAVFIHKGSSTDLSTFQFIFGSWLPASGFDLDHREHFELLGDKYKNNQPDSEEEIWIPIKPKD